MSGPFVLRNGEVTLSVGDDERNALRSVPVLLEGGDAGGRLNYSAHPEDPDSDAKYRELLGDDLNQLRRTDRAAFGMFVAGETGSPETLEAFIRVIGEGRIVLADRLGLEADGWESELDPQANPELALLGWLGYLQDAAVEVLSEFL